MWRAQHLQMDHVAWPRPIAGCFIITSLWSDDKRLYNNCTLNNEVSSFTHSNNIVNCRKCHSPGGLFSSAGISQRMYQRPKWNRHFCQVFKRDIFSVSISVFFVSFYCSLQNLRQRWSSIHRSTVTANEWCAKSPSVSYWFRICIIMWAHLKAAEFIGNK